jgi:membrane protein implicated in regulation of membrane protease activity
MELLAFVEEWAWIGWLVLMLVFLVIEMLTLDLTFLMLSIGSLAGLGSDLLGAPLWLQVILAAVVAAVLLLALRPPLLRRLHRGGDDRPSNIDALLGIEGRVLATVSGAGGQVKLANGDIWTARADSDPGSETVALEPGSPVRVTRIDGATAVVRARAEKSPE